MSEDKIYPSMVIRIQADAIELLEQENKQLKEVIKEVREYIEKSILIEGVKETGVGYYENIKVNKTKLLQILDKVKGE